MLGFYFLHRYLVKAKRREPLPRTIAKSLIQGSYEFQGVEGIGAEIIGSGSKRLFGFLGR